MSKVTERLNNLQLGPTSNVVHGGVTYDTATEPVHALSDERSRTKFNVREMTYFLDGGKDVTEATELFMRTIERDPVFRNDDYYDLDHETLREQTTKRVAKISEYVYTSSTEVESTQRLAIIGLVDPGSYTRCGVHYGLFLSGVRSSGTSEQFQYWVSQGAGTMSKFAGCFGMTELGHGSNVAGVETTATFDAGSDEFIVNTPHLAATKWWIGGAAHTATHCLVYARLIVKGKDYGVRNFVVPLRNVNNHSLLQGVAIGDIGKKMGRDGIDNGWIQFTNVRIPRQFMCMKYAKVDRQGNVTEPPLAQLSYGALVGGRVSMASDSFHFAKRFLTIAIRYAAARRQFSSDSSQVESKILDYTYHQRRLIPKLAYAYAMRASSEELYQVYFDTTTKLANTKPSDKVALQAAITDMKELFGLSAGLKAFSTWGTAQIIDECRQACGGQGYSGYNGFGQGYNDWVVQCTWEGDNNVLTLSAGRALILSALKIKKGQTQVGEVIAYLLKHKDDKSLKTLGQRDIRDPSVVLEAWETMASKAIFHAVDDYVKLTEQKGLNATQAFEELSQQRFEVARIHTRLYVIKAFYDKIAKSATSAIKPILLQVATLFSLWSIEQDAAMFLKSGYLTGHDIDQITEYVNHYCHSVREQAIGLTDAFNLSDFYVNSPIGKYDGNIYHNIIEKAKSRDKYLKDSKPPYYSSVMRPFLFREESQEPDLSDMGDV